jgi:hypothetical protein
VPDKGIGGVIPLAKGERERIEKEFNEEINLFSNKSKVKVSSASMVWQPMSYPVKDLMLIEECEDDFQTIIGAFGMDRDEFPSSQGATFENKNQGSKSSYEKGVIPIAEDLANCMTTELGVDTRGRVLVLDYSHLPIMQEDKVQAETAKKINVETLAILYRERIIDAKSFAEQAGVEFTGTGEQEELNQEPKTIGLNAAA